MQQQRDRCIARLELRQGARSDVDARRVTTPVHRWTTSEAVPLGSTSITMRYRPKPSTTASRLVVMPDRIAALTSSSDRLERAVQELITESNVQAEDLAGCVSQPGSMSEAVVDIVQQGRVASDGPSFLVLVATNIGALSSEQPPDLSDPACLLAPDGSCLASVASSDSVHLFLYDGDLSQCESYIFSELSTRLVHRRVNDSDVI